MKIKQHIPDGKHCAIFGNEYNKPEELCVFVKSTPMIRTDSAAYMCARHPEYELDIVNEVGKRKICKCFPCLEETVQYRARTRVFDGDAF